MEKADLRSFRIRNNNEDDMICYFMNLDYQNQHIPYIHFDDIQQFLAGMTDSIPVRRILDCHLKRKVAYKRVKKKRGKGYCKSKVRKYRADGSVDAYYIKETKLLRKPIGYINIKDRDWSWDFRLSLHRSLPKFNGLRTKLDDGSFYVDPYKYGVLWYEDIQDYFKRVRKNVKKKYDDFRFSYFVCGEYGEDYGRPHFHVLLFFPRRYEGQAKSIFLKNWHFASYKHLERRFEPAINAASYVSQYVNCDSQLPEFLRYNKQIRPMWHYSKGFGVGSTVFQFRSLCEMFVKRDFTYLKATSGKQPDPVKRVFVPSYVISRYFPKFKGYSRLNSSALHDFVLSALRLDDSQFGVLANRLRLEYDSEDAHKVRTMIYNKFLLCKSQGLPLNSFLDMYTNIWSIRESNLLKYSLLEVADWTEYYDYVQPRAWVHFSEFLDKFIQVEYPPNLPTLSPNLLQRNILRTQDLSARYKNNIKTRSINAHAYMGTSLYFT